MKNNKFKFVSFSFLFFLMYINAFGMTYEIGPGKQYNSILQINTHNLQAGDSVKVYYQATPYFEKFLLHGIGTISDPIVFIGIPDSNGNKPVLNGNNALSNTNSTYWNEDRQVVLIGQSGSVESDYIIVDGFEIRGGNNNNTFTDDSGTVKNYKANACGIRISWGKNITIRNCDITDNGMGIQSGKEDNMDLTIEYCYVYDNGKCTWNNSYIHNFYLSSGANSTVTVQYCHIGELLSNGQQLKSRANTTVVRYNWIEGGRNSSLDLVEHTTNSELYASDAYVYGNVIIKPNNSENSRIIHFGADNSGHFRLGTCYFYNNTIIIKDTKTFGSRRVFHLSDSVADLVADNNIVYKDDAVNYNLKAGSNNLTGSDNWFSDNINGISTLTNSLSGADPEFTDYLNDNYELSNTSPCIDILSSYNYPVAYDLLNQYIKHELCGTRPTNGNIDLGAFELASPLPIELINFSGDLFGNYVKLVWNTGSEINNKGFEIQKLDLFGEWKVVGFKEGKDHIVGNYFYTFNDRKPTDGANYYRLKQIDFDGKYEYSKVVIVTYNNLNNILVYPNPTNGMMYIDGSEISEIVLSDLNGKSLKKFTATSTIDVSGFNIGGYLLRVRTETKEHVFKIVIQ